MSFQLIGRQEDVQRVEFKRRDGFHLHHGVVVEYGVPQTGFTVRMTRDDIEIQGALSFSDESGVRVLQAVLARAVLQHNHLKSFPIGEKQVALTEEQLTLLMMMPTKAVVTNTHTSS